MVTLEEKLFEKIKTSGDLDFPGLKLSVFQNGRPRLRTHWGQIYPYYDIASLTKIVFTTLWFMEAHSFKKIDLSRPVKAVLPWYRFDTL